MGNELLDGFDHTRRSLIQVFDQPLDLHSLGDKALDPFLDARQILAGFRQRLACGARQAVGIAVAVLRRCQGIGCRLVLRPRRLDLVAENRPARLACRSTSS